MNFRQLDLNLLRVLCAVQRTGSVTAAGRELALSQPATSNALARLRLAFGDALFVRSPSGLHPTRLALRVVPVVAAHLRELESALAAEDHFDPATGHVHWRLSLSDLGEMMFLPPLARVLRSQAPGCQVSNVAVDAGRVSAALEAGDVDLAIGLLLPEHAGVASEPLVHERFVAISGPDWSPAVGRVGATLSARQLAQASLAVALPTASYHGRVAQMLARLKLSERTVVQVRHYGALPELVCCTDLLAIVPKMFADSLARRFAVRVWELPSQGLQYDVRMMWHHSTGNDAALGWLRERVRGLYPGSAVGREIALRPSPAAPGLPA